MVAVSTAGEFLHLFARLRAAFAELRSVRIAVLSVGNALSVPLQNRLLSLSQAEEPTDAQRYTGYPVDEALISAWVAAATKLRDDADAPLPALRSGPQASFEVRRDASIHRGGKRVGGAKPLRRPSAT